MPSEQSFEEESNTTLRRRASHLAKQKWPTRVKWWIGSVAASIPIVYFLIGGFMWVKTEVAWAEDVKKSATLQYIEVNQLRTEDRMWKIKHDLRDIEARAQAGNALATDALDKTQLLGEYAFLLEQKQKWDSAEKEAAK